MATQAQINGWFPNSGTADPANLRTALIEGNGTTTAVQNFHTAVDADAALGFLGATTTGLSVLKAASQAAARAAIGAAPDGAAVDLRTGSATIAAALFPGTQVVTITAAATLTLPARTAVPTGTEMRFVNTAGSTAAVTVARAGADTIDGATSVTIYPGESFMLIAGAGAAWHSAQFPAGWRRIQGLTVSGAPATIDLPLPAEFTVFRLEALLWPSVAAIIQARVSVDGGTTYLAGAADYRLNVISNSGGTASAAAIDVNAMRLSVGVNVATAADALASTATMFPGGGGVSPRLTNVAAGFESGGGANQQAGVVQNVARGTTTRATHLRLLTSAGVFANGGVVRLFGLG